MDFLGGRTRTSAGGCLQGNVGEEADAGTTRQSQTTGRVGPGWSRLAKVSPIMMEPKELARLAGRLMSCPAAPFHEAGVRAVVELICAENHLNCERDGFGNVLVRLGDKSAGRPLVLAAHMDHPGF